MGQIWVQNLALREGNIATIEKPHLWRGTHTARPPDPPRQLREGPAGPPTLPIGVQNIVAFRRTFLTFCLLTLHFSRVSYLDRPRLHFPNPIWHQMLLSCKLNNYWYKLKAPPRTASKIAHTLLILHKWKSMKVVDLVGETRQQLQERDIATTRREIFPMQYGMDLKKTRFEEAQKNHADR